MASGQAPTAGEYIVHHLQHLQFNFNLEGVKQSKIVDFSLFNADSVFYSIVLGILGCFFLWISARKATSGVPGRFQAAVELLSEEGIVVGYPLGGNRLLMAATEMTTDDDIRALVQALGEVSA